MHYTLSRSRIRPLSWFLGGVLLLLAGGGPGLWAQEDGTTPPPLNEQTVYIPYEKLRDVFEREGRGVFIPYEQFQALWKAARENQAAPPAESAPLGAVITDIESTATLGQEVVSVDAILKVELLKKGWHRIPLRLSGAAIRRAEVNGREAVIVTQDNGDHEWLVEQRGDEPAKLELRLGYAKALVKSEGRSNVAFAAPQAPINRWAIRTGDEQIDVQIQPMIAASRGDGQSPFDPTGDTLLAFVGTAPEVSLTWTPKAEGASGLAALVSAQSQTQVQISRGVLRSSVRLDLDISRAEVEALALRVPGDQKVVNVFDRNVKKWTVQEADGQQQIDIEWFEPALGKQQLVVEMERFVDDLEAEPLSIPRVSVPTASRISGVLLVRVAEGLRAEPRTRDGLLQLDQTEIERQNSDPWNLGFRFNNDVYQLTLAIEPIQPQVQVEQLVELGLSPRRLHAVLQARYSIEAAGVFQLPLILPPSWNIVDVRVSATAGETPVQVEDYQRDPDNENQVWVTLNRKALGQFDLRVELEQNLDDPNLLTPTESASSFPLELPKSAVEGVKFSQGNLMVYASDSLQVTASQTQGMRKVSFDQALTHLSRSIEDGLTPVLAFRFAHSPASLDLQAKRRQPQVNVDQIVTIAVSTGSARFDSRLFYDVRYSGVDGLRLDVPADLVDQLRIRTEGIQKQTLQPQPGDVAEGQVALLLTADSEFLGAAEIRLQWEREIGGLTLGQQQEITVDRIQPRQVDRATGKIVLTKSETIDVRPGSQAVGLRPIDPQTDLRPGLMVADAAMAFEFAEDWSLQLQASRFELQELKRTSISRAVIRAVALRQNEISFQCLYQIRSVNQRLAIQMPAGFDPATSFDDQPIRINGSAVPPERGGDDLIYVPLTGQQADEPFLLDLRYTLPGGSRLALPEFTEDPAAQKSVLCLYLPFEESLVGYRGPWTDEHQADGRLSAADALNWESGIWSRMFHRREQPVEPYLTWVREGVSGIAADALNFEVDGRPYVFSAIRPAPGAAGAFSMTRLNTMLLNGIACALMGLLGLVGLRRPVSQQLGLLLLGLAALMLAGLFWPLLTEHLIGGALVSTGLIVLLAWGLQHLVQGSRSLTPRLAAIRSWRRPPAENAPDPPAEGSPPASEDSSGDKNDSSDATGEPS